MKPNSVRSAILSKSLHRKKDGPNIFRLGVISFLVWIVSSVDTVTIFETTASAPDLAYDSLAPRLF